MQTYLKLTTFLKTHETPKLVRRALQETFFLKKCIIKNLTFIALLGCNQLDLKFM